MLKENNQLKRQLVEVQQQLTKILIELKSLKDGKASKLTDELTATLENNSQLINNNSGDSTQISQQLAKSQQLAQAASANLNTGTSTIQPEKPSLFPYAVGGILIIGAFLTFGYYLVKRNNKNK